MSREDRPEVHEPHPFVGQEPCGSLEMLGCFRLIWDGRRIELPGATQRVVALIALAGEQSRSRVSGRLWPDTTEDRARASLRSALWQLNRVVPGMIVCEAATLKLASCVRVDLRWLSGAAERILAGESFDGGSTVRELCERDLLPDWEAEWLDVERDRLRELRLHVLAALALEHTNNRRYDLAIDAALAALAVDPCLESAHRVLIRAHLAEGNVAAAVRAYRACENTLLDELGIAPSGETADLVIHLVPEPREPARMSLRVRAHGLVTLVSMLAESTTSNGALLALV